MRARRMTRSFSGEPIDEATIESLLDIARRVPSAGSAQGFEFLVLSGTDDVGRYWDVTLPQAKRPGFRWQGLLRAPLLVLVYAHAEAYVQRYGEPDKASTGLGEGREAWSTRYWLVDASFAALGLQLAALDAGLGVLFFGVFDHQEAVATEFGVPESHEVVGAIAIGHPDGGDDEEPGRSAKRARRPLDDIVHRGNW